MITVKNLVKKYKTAEKSKNILTNFFARKYKEKIALDSISFQIEKGELIGFIGPNGAGKTTTMKILAGILHPDGGEVNVLEHTPFEKKYDYLKDISFVMGQRNQLIWDLPAMDSFLLNQKIYEIENKNFKDRIKELSELLKCEEIINQPVKTLSLGQRMRVELIASLLHQPKVLFLDEPTIGLDIFAQTTIINFIKEYQKKYNSTIILTSHYMQDVQRLAQRIIMIDQGRLIFNNSLNKLIEEYSQKKSVNITLQKNINTEELKEMKQKFNYEYKYPVLKIKMTKKELNETLPEILKNINYNDVTIENESLEEIIKKKYRNIN
jgi:ABC-2 type transport system ATP-binding protein